MVYKKHLFLSAHLEMIIYVKWGKKWQHILLSITGL